MYCIAGDGVCISLYEYLWCKDEVNFSPHINIPDTVVYKYGQPVHWYFTAVDGTLKKKLRSNMTNAKIEEAFLKKAKAQRGSGGGGGGRGHQPQDGGSGGGGGGERGGGGEGATDVVAYYICWETNAGEGGEKGGGDPAPAEIEYFDGAGLNDFLFHRAKQHNGILQAFVEPKGASNAMVRAVWTPKLCLTERRVNTRKLRDRRYGLYERAVTYDGPDIYSTARPLRGTVMPTAVRHLCEAVAAHVAEVTVHQQRIACMALNLKIDARDRLWLLWSSSIRLARDSHPGTPRTAPTSRAHTPDGAAADAPKGGLSRLRSPVYMSEVVRVPAHLRLRQAAVHDALGAAPAPPPRARCASCGVLTPSDGFHAVPYKTVVVHFEQVLDLASHHPEVTSGAVRWPPSAEIIAAAGGVGFGGAPDPAAPPPRTISLEDVTVPPVIRALHPNLAADAYARHRRDPLFLYKTAEVCEACYLAYSALASLAFRAGSRRQLAAYTASLTAVATRLAHDDDFGARPSRRARAAAAAAAAEQEASAEWGWAGGARRSPSPGRRGEGGGVTASAVTLPLEGSAKPDLPALLRSQSDVAAELSHLCGAADAHGSGGGGGGGGGGHRGFNASASSLLLGGGGGGWGGAASVEEMIRRKEEDFLREVRAMKGAWKKGGGAGRANGGACHPLEHLITSRRKLAAMVLPPSEIDPTAAMEHGRRARISPYLRAQVLVEYLGHNLKNSASVITVGGANFNNGNFNNSAAAPPQPAGLSKSAVRHRQFLEATLGEVQAQLGGQTLAELAAVATAPAPGAQQQQQRTHGGDGGGGAGAMASCPEEQCLSDSEGGGRGCAAEHVEGTYGGGSAGEGGGAGTPVAKHCSVADARQETLDATAVQ